MERFMDKVQLFTISTIDHANTESELLDIYNYVHNHGMLSGTIIMTFLKNPKTPEEVIQKLVSEHCTDLKNLSSTAILFLASNPNTPTPILEQIAEMELSEEAKKQLLNNPGTPYSIKEALDGENYQRSGFCL